MSNRAPVKKQISDITTGAGFNGNADNAYAYTFMQPPPYGAQFLSNFTLCNPATAFELASSPSGQGKLVVAAPLHQELVADFGGEFKADAQTCQHVGDSAFMKRGKMLGLWKTK